MTTMLEARQTLFVGIYSNENFPISFVNGLLGVVIWNKLV